MTVNIRTAAVTAKLTVAAGAVAVGGLSMGAGAAHADDTVVEQTTVVEQQPQTVAGDQPTTERRAVVRIIGKNPRPMRTQG